MAPPDSAEPRWLTAGLDHVWLPYAQMKTAARPLPVVASEGVRLTLADGRVLVFEANAAMCVHPEPEDGVFAAKNAHISPIIAAFQRMLTKAAGASDL